MTVRDFLRRTNNHVKWRLTDRFAKENQSEVLDRKIYMFFQVVKVVSKQTVK